MSPKLVEVSIPVEEISLASKKDKDKKTGTIRNVHKWFAPMPTPAWRALLFSALIDDPGNDEARIELLDFVKKLVPPDGNPPSETVLAEARKRILEATGGDPPPVFDPFCGGGSTLVEAQRLGLPATGSDLNPVPVLITRTLTELVPQVRDRKPLVGDSAALGTISGGGLDGFLADCKHYATRVRDEVWAQIGHLYPAPPGGGTVIAWLWARTVTCPNPACRAITPLVSSYWLSKRKAAPTWVEPIPQGPGKPVVFEVKTGKGAPPKPTKVGRGGNFVCAVCGSAMPEEHQKAEGMAGRLGTQLMAVAVDGPNGRTYLSPISDHEGPTASRPSDAPTVELPDETRAFWCRLYGITTWADVFTNRQLVALSSFADTVAKVPQWVKADGGDATYATAVTSVLGLCVGKLAMTNSTQARWYIGGDTGSTRVQAAFSRHALPMVWDFVELNPFSDRAANWMGVFESVESGLKTLIPMAGPSVISQIDARNAASTLESPVLIATDPPYFAQIGYADLSDYFYIWLRRALKDVHPDLFKTVATPKTDELIAAPYRHGGNKTKATHYFVEGFTETFANLSEASHPDLPIMIVYAHRQEESSDGESSSTGWDAMLTAIIRAGLSIVGTWPIHATTPNRQIGQGTNSLATYVVLVCRPRQDTAKPVDLPHFKGKLRAELKSDIKKMQEASISSIDLAQAAIGPGMRIFTGFESVLNTQGHPMKVAEALKEIGEVLGELLDDFAGKLDAETRWAMRFYREVGFAEAPFDIAEKIFKQVNTSIDAVEAKGIALSRAGKVSLVNRADLAAGKWNPPIGASDGVVWEMLQRIVWELRDERGGGEDGAAKILSACMGRSNDIQDLAYWLARDCASRRPDEVLDYDAVTTSWSQLTKKAREIIDTKPVVQTFDDYDPDDEGSSS